MPSYGLRSMTRVRRNSGAAWSGFATFWFQRWNRAIASFQEHHIAIRLDLNLDRRSTNHAHADFWFIETGGQEGPKYSINVRGGREVWLYKAGAPGRVLGTTDDCGDDQLRELLCCAAKEFGALTPRDPA